jgi:hypothetical protein
MLPTPPSIQKADTASGHVYIRLLHIKYDGKEIPSLLHREMRSVRADRAPGTGTLTATAALYTLIVFTISRPARRSINRARLSFTHEV